MHPYITQYLKVQVLFTDCEHYYGSKYELVIEQEWLKVLENNY